MTTLAAFLALLKLAEVLIVLIRKIRHTLSELSFSKQAKIKGACSRGGSLSNEAGCCTTDAACASVCAHAPFRRELDIRNVASAIF